MSTPLPLPHDPAASPAPGTPQTADKAYNGGFFAGIVGGVLFVAGALYYGADFDIEDALLVLLGALGLGGGTGKLVHRTKNKPKPDHGRRTRDHNRRA